MMFRNLARVATVAGLGVLVTAPAVMAQTDAAEAPVITLKSFDGFTQIRGKLLEYDGTKYRIDTALGEMSVEAKQVNCEGEGCPQNMLYGAEFGVMGSNTIGADLMPSLVEGYADSLDAELVIETGAAPFERVLRIIDDKGEEMAAIDLQAKGSSTAFASLAGGTADIGMASRRARDSDMPQLLNAGIDDPRGTDKEHVVGIDGLIVVTHRDNPLQALSLEELALVFSGTVTNWSQVGGLDAPITVMSRDPESGTFQTFESIALRPYGVELSPEAQTFGSNVALSDAVAGDPNAIGVTAIAYERAAKAVALRQECGILSFPTTFAMKTGEYPLTRSLYLYAPRDQMTAHARKLIEFAKSDAAQPLIVDAGFVSLETESSPINNQGARIVYALTGEDEVSLPDLRDFVNEVRNAVRLSTTFRFTPGESTLDPTSQAAAEQLARDIAAGDYAGKEVMLIGFTDSVGQFELNRALSSRRAQVVSDVLAAAVEPGALASALISIKGYGELAPVGCNTSPSGRSSNRRVEVWVRDPV